MLSCVLSTKLPGFLHWLHAVVPVLGGPCGLCGGAALCLDVSDCVLGGFGCVLGGMPVSARWCLIYLPVWWGSYTLGILCVAELCGLCTVAPHSALM